MVMIGSSNIHQQARFWRAVAILNRCETTGRRNHSRPALKGIRQRRTQDFAGFDRYTQTGTPLRLSVFGVQPLYMCEDNSRAFAGAVLSPVMRGAINVAAPENHAGNSSGGLKWPKHRDARKGAMCARRPPSTTSSRTCTSQSRLRRNTMSTTQPRPAARRSRIRFARNGIPAKVACPFSDENLFYTIDTGR